MKSFVPLTVLLISHTSLPVYAYCPPGDPSWLSYIRRDNNRCEGMKDGRDASSSLSLRSFMTSSLTNLPSSLSIWVAGSSTPNVVVQEFSRNYLLDDVNMIPSGKNSFFSLNTDLMRRVGIRNVNSLFAHAYVIQNASTVYYPVVLGKKSNSYTYVLYAPGSSVLEKIQIRQLGNNKTFLNQSLSQPRKGVIPFQWKYGNASSGDYELYVEDGSGNPRRFRFKHNPKWL
jgi:flagellar basal-body rod modification protein FlgD